ncbi:MAG: hypothetical protein ACYS9X_31175 [Planctomycetota bacterium]|jgi:hypothetical protein
MMTKRIGAAVFFLGIGASAFAAPGGDAKVFRDPAVAQAVFAAGEVRGALKADPIQVPT